MAVTENAKLSETEIFKRYFHIDFSCLIPVIIFPALTSNRVLKLSPVHYACGTLDTLSFALSRVLYKIPNRQNSEIDKIWDFFHSEVFQFGFCTSRFCLLTRYDIALYHKRKFLLNFCSCRCQCKMNQIINFLWLKTLIKVLQS